MAATLACFQADGNWLVSRERFISFVRGPLSCAAASFKTFGGRASGPGDLFSLREVSLFFTVSCSMVMSGRILGGVAMGKSGIGSVSFVKTEPKSRSACLLSQSRWHWFSLVK